MGKHWKSCKKNVIKTEDKWKKNVIKIEKINKNH